MPSTPHHTYHVIYHHDGTHTASHYTVATSPAEARKKTKQEVGAHHVRSIMGTKKSGPPLTKKQVHMITGHHPD